MARKARIPLEPEPEQLEEPDRSRAELSARKLEAAGISIVLLGFGLSFALVSFDPSDPTASQRLVGPVGHGASRVMLEVFGLLGYVYVLAATFAVGMGLVGRARPDRPTRTLALFAMALSSLVLADLAAGTTRILGSLAGGELGAFLSENASGLIGPAGTALLAVGVLLISALAATKTSFFDVLADTKEAAVESRSLLRGLIEARRSVAETELEADTEISELAADAGPTPKKERKQRTRSELAAETADGPKETSPIAEAAPMGSTPGEGTPITSTPPAPDFLLPARKVEGSAAAPKASSPNLGPKIIELRPEGPDRSLLEGRADLEREEKKEYELPPLRLLDYDAPEEVPLDEVALRDSALRLESKLLTYGVEGKVVAIRPGPVVTTYEYLPAPGVKVAKIASLTDDIAMSMEAESVRIIAPIPGKGVVGIELPNRRRATVFLKEIIAHDRFNKSQSLLSLALGKDTEGETQVRDLQKMPHLLVAGTTGSGKSVSVNTMILSILYKATPEQVKFIMVDPKMLELSLYEDIPHLLLPVVTDAKKAAQALAWAVDEMERRYRLLSEHKVRNIEGFNRKLESLAKERETEGDITSELPNALPYIVVLIDEFADLMCVAPKDIESSVQRLAQKARAAGIHVLLATQRPSTDVITGVIKNNFPSRISFQVASRHDSQTVINQPGAENLLGMGDMLWLGNTSPSPVRIHGAFVSEKEVERVATFWRSQARPVYDETILRAKEGDDIEEIDASERDEMYDRAVQIVTETRKASISAIQRRLRVGYNRAARMIEMMEKDGIVGPAVGPKGEREVNVSAMGPDGPEVS
ncbi:MAG: DNA translocase FtsK 4TM domain-containing protein [Deltaproteobacteria bacterium]|nr:DNA translocase FtsK 4TM domain-containing protein [Deltaproteobacteria bacterium]